MRALIGAIISAGAMIGLGLTGIGLGIRYQSAAGVGQPIYEMLFKQVDHPLQFEIVFLTIMALVGLGIAFVGLMYHHERRFREGQLADSQQRTLP